MRYSGTFIEQPLVPLPAVLVSVNLFVVALYGCASVQMINILECVQNQRGNSPFNFNHARIFDLNNNQLPCFVSRANIIHPV